ncbi:hypothetical protein T12_12593 [Trichinella patagoniensis]|uniref:Uncharacterized protein n=1 Tax=Trichinella patagoniensis TaxID=990121 RepID=A0A0V0Z311_9BILA|nr:hypothetical protein T12_12593 [Trichinella patagoniensis]
MVDYQQRRLKTGCLKTAVKRFMTAYTIQRRTHMRKGFLKILLTKSKQRRTEVVRVLRRVRKQNNTHENTGSYDVLLLNIKNIEISKTLKCHITYHMSKLTERV